MRKHKGFISIQVIILASLLITSTDSLDKMSHRNRILISREKNILTKGLQSINEEVTFINEAIIEFNNILETDEGAFDILKYEKLSMKLYFSLEKNVFILEEKLKNISSKKISYYDYFKEDKILKLKKRRFYEFKG